MFDDTEFEVWPHDFEIERKEKSMSQKEIKLTGIANWAKIQFPDEYLGVERYTIALTLDAESLGAFKASGSRLKIKDTDDGPVVNLKKTVNPPANWKTPWGAPPITYKGERDDSIIIGNGSKVECKVEIYPTAYGIGTRLKSINIIDLVPFNQPDDEESQSPQESVKTQTETKDEKAPW